MDKNEQTQIAAYYLWQKNGSPEGRSDEFWYEAVTQMGGCGKNNCAKMGTKKKAYPPKAKTNLK